MEPLEHLDRVAGRMNRLALQRAAYRTLGVGAFGIALLAPAALWLPPAAFFGLAVAVTLVGLCVGAISFWTLRTSWVERGGAARLVENEIDLEQRLLTLVSAPDEMRDTGLWKELESDNDRHLAAWKDERLGIPRVPANVALLVAGLVALVLALAPQGGDVSPPPPVPSLLPRPQEEPPTRAGTVPAPGTGETNGTLSAAAPQEGSPGKTQSSFTQIQTRLGTQFARSFAAQALGSVTQTQDSGGASAHQERRDRTGPNKGDAVSPSGEVPPPHGGEHLVQNAARDQNLPGFEDNPRDERSGPSRERLRAGQATREDDTTDGSAAGDATDPRKREPESRRVASEDTMDVPGSGGSLPGDRPGSGPLLATSPLESGRSRRVARFSVALGAMSESEGGEGGNLAGDVDGHVAEGQRGEQEADRGVRHDSIPPEYETVIKRIFERNT